MARAQTRFGHLVVGLAPQVVGTVSQADALARLGKGMDRACDIVEVRLDLIGTEPTQWLESAKAIESQGIPVIATIRLANEGGQWTQPDAARLPLFETALEHLSAVDIELSSPLLQYISAAATRRRRALIVSHHDFVRTPSATELLEAVRKAVGYAAVVKIATFTKSEQDLDTLRSLLAEDCARPLCVLGMGPLGPQSRAEFPKLGSCLTYGYLDAPVAPGQVSAQDLMKQLHRS